LFVRVLDQSWICFAHEMIYCFLLLIPLLLWTVGCMKKRSEIAPAKPRPSVSPTEPKLLPNAKRKPTVIPSRNKTSSTETDNVPKLEEELVDKAKEKEKPKAKMEEPTKGGKEQSCVSTDLRSFTARSSYKKDSKKDKKKTVPQKEVPADDKNKSQFLGGPGIDPGIASVFLPTK